jgi:uncharacterized membrane protein YkvA (DUF1232 family)
MSKQRSGPPATPEDVAAFTRWFRSFFRQFRLAWMLLLDERVPLLTKFVPFLSLAYVISWIDFVPDVMLGFGQMDDVAIFLVGIQLFINLCPPHVVEEYRVALREEEIPPDEREDWPRSGEQVIDVDATESNQLTDDGG